MRNSYTQYYGHPNLIIINILERISAPLELDGTQMQYGSDYHYTIGTPTSTITKEILADYISGNVLCIHGDIFNNPTGIDTSKQINGVLKVLAENVSQLIFIPGNHDLRGRDTPWESFVIPENTLYPTSPLDPLVTTIGNTKICVAHLFFDFTFIETDNETLSSENMEKFYKSMPDGQYIMKGDTSIFEPTKQALSKVLDTQKIDIVITHVPIHPSIASILGDMDIKDSTVQHITGEDVIIEHTKKYSHSEYLEENLKNPQKFMNYWNRKGCMLGADVLKGIAVEKPLISIYGHNHRGNYQSEIQKNGHTVSLISGPQPWIDRSAK